MFKTSYRVFSDKTNKNPCLCKKISNFLIIPLGYDFITVFFCLFLSLLCTKKIFIIGSVLLFFGTRAAYKLGLRILLLAKANEYMMHGKSNLKKNFLYSFYWNFGPQILYVFIIDFIIFRYISKLY